MDIQILILFIALTLVAEILGTIGGFGSSVFFVPIAGYFFDFYSVLGITVVFHLLSNLSKIYMFRNAMDKRILLLIGVPSVSFVLVGAMLTKVLDLTVLKFVLACFLIALSLFFLIRKNFEWKPNALNAITGGASSGFIAGLVGTGGAIRGMTLAAFNLEKHVFIATSAMIDLFVDSGRAVVYAFNGFIHGHDLFLIPFLFFAAIAGTWIGKKLLDKIPQVHFRSIVLVLILIVGLVSLIEDFI